MGKAEEARSSAAAAASAAEPPPPYQAESSTTAAAAPASTSASTTPGGGTGGAGQGMTFPPALDGYYKLKLALQGYLAVEKDRPLYRLQWNTIQSGKPDIVLYAPSDEQQSEKNQEPKQLAACRRNDTMGRQVKIVLPPLPGSPYDHSSETLQAEAGFGLTTYRFSTEVGAAEEQQVREDFEWRPLSADDPARGDLERKDGGFKLVRLSSVAGVGAGEGGAEPEILAVCCRARTWASLTRSWEFRFRGSSLGGGMGGRFELVALMTGLMLWGFEFQTKYGADPTKMPPARRVLVV